MCGRQAGEPVVASKRSLNASAGVSMAEIPSFGFEAAGFAFEGPVDLSSYPEIVRDFASWSKDAPNPLIVVGPNASGKTVLLRAIAEAAQRSALDKKVLYLGVDKSSRDARMWSGPQRHVSITSSSIDLLDSDVQEADLILLDGAFEVGFQTLTPRTNAPLAVRQIEDLVGRGVRICISLTNGNAVVDAKHYMSRLNGPRAAILGLSAEEFLNQKVDSTIEKIKSFEIKDLPPQSAIAPQFDFSREGPISIAREPAPTVTEEKLELYEEFRLKASDLLLSFQDRGNRLLSLKRSVEGLIEYLPESFIDFQPRRAWARANKLRRYRDADLRARRSPDPDTPPLPELVSELLSDLVEQFNVFAFHDADLRQQDAASLGPKSRAELLIELDAGRTLTDAITRTPGLVDKPAKALLEEAEEQATEAASQSGVNADQALIQAVDTQRNGAIALVAKAIGESKKKLKSVEDGGLKYVGSEATKLIFSGFVRLYEGPISTLIGHIHGSDVIAYAIRLLRQVTGI